MKWVNGQAFAPHDEWECVKTGFHNIKYNEEHANESRDLYANIPKLRDWVFRLIEEWPTTVAVHLSQKRNYRAWIGHAACFLHHGAGMDSSIAAYWMLDEIGRENANNCVMEGFHKWTTIHKHNLEQENYHGLKNQLEFRF